jgi:hypothetical protein
MHRNGSQKKKKKKLERQEIKHCKNIHLKVKKETGNFKKCTK